MKYLVGFVLLFLFTTLFASDCFTIQSASTQEIVLSFALPDFQVITDKAHAGFSNIRFNDTQIDQETLNNGRIPQFSRFVNVPEGKTIKVSLTSCVYDTLKTTFFYEDEPQVERSIKKQDFIETGEIGILRDQIVSPICINPVLYDPVTGISRILRQAQVHIDFVSSSEGKYLSVQPPSSRSWTRLTEDIMLNTSESTPRSLSVPGSYVIIYNGDALLSTLQPLINWKYRKGYEVHVVKLSDIGSTTTAIKNYLQNAYNTWTNPPEYILLAGDVSGTYAIPTYQSHFTAQPFEFDTVGDNDYTKLSGTDDYPDAFIGRICFSTVNELGTQVNRIVNYEKNINLGSGNWYEKTLLVGDASNSGTSTQTTMYYIKDLITDYNPNQTFSEVYNGNFPSLINTAINSGVSAYYYRGFGDFSGYNSQSFNALVNYGKFPVITYITCFGGDYASINYGATSQAEQFMRIGTPAEPKGAIAVYAPSSETHTCFNNLLTGAFAYGLYKDGCSNPGQAVIRSKLALISNYPSNPQNYVKQYLMANNLLGDPGTELWLHTPGTMMADYPLSASPGNGSIQVTVRDQNNNPLPDAWVCLQKGSGEVFTSAFTDEQGQVSLSYSGATSGLCNITITKQNFTPILNTITINTTHSNLEFSSLVGNGEYQAGSVSHFYIKVKNYSTVQLSDITGEITTNNPYVSITNAISGYPTASAGTEVTSNLQYSLHIDASCPKGTAIPMTLIIHQGAQSYNSSFSIIENGLNMQIDVIQLGTGGNIINPGETQPLYITVQNLSLWNAVQLHTELISPVTMITFPTEAMDISSIPVGTSYTNSVPYQVHVGNEALNGQVISLELHLFTDDGWNQYLPFQIQIGQVALNDPTGPDRYGYYCVESRDTGSAYSPQYQWIELDPTYGGNGTNLNLSDMDDTGSGAYATITLPFSFKFYGQIYDHITITSNGYIMPGSQGSIEWMNWTVPGPMVPKPIIAPFWDDLLTINGGKVLYQYRSDLHAMVVEWSRMRNSYNSNAIETFAVWLHDTPADTALSSDNTITFQYHTINNVDAGNYIGEYLEHGEYATVGIADHTGEIGLQYTYSNVYPASARSLTNMIALRFVSINPVTVNPRPVIASMTIADPLGNNNSLAEYGETVTVNLSIRNQGQDTLPASTLTLSTDDQYATLINAASTLPAIEYFQEATPIQPLQIHLAGNVPDLHAIPLNLHIQTITASYDLQLSIIAHAPDLIIQSVTFTDTDNGYPEPGEGLLMNLHMQNISSIGLSQAVVQPIFPTGWNVMPTSQTVDFPANSTVSAEFLVYVSPDFPVGTQCVYQVSVTCGAFEWQQSKDIVIGVPEMLFADNLDNYPSAAQWAGLQAVSIQDAEYIHNSGKEAVFSVNANGSYMITPILNANDLQALNVKFNFMNLNPHCEYGCLLSLDGSNWTEVWSDTAYVDVPTTRELTLSVTSDSWMMYLAFYASPVVQLDDGLFIMDDFYIAGIHHEPGTIQGHISLIGGSGDVTQVEIMAYPDMHTVHPDAAGNYSLPAYQGQYPAVIALLPGYQWDQQDSVTVVSNQVTSISELVLEEYQPIVELTHTVSGNTLSLEWTMGRDITRKIMDRDIAPNQFKVHIQKNNMHFTDTTTNTHYTHALFGSGTYTIYVVAEFYFQGELVYSDTSNVIHEIITSNGDQIAPSISGLNQNYPNPFSEQTCVTYDISKDSRSFCIEVFNVRGERIRTLEKGNKKAGSYSLVWDGTNDKGRKVASGVYFLKMETDQQKWVRKTILMR